MRSALLGALASAALAGCATTEAPPSATAAVSALRPEPGEPYRSMMLPADVATVGPALENVAARCWLDGELRAANLLVDQTSGTLAFFNDGGQILTAEIHPRRTQLTEVRFSGAAIEEPGRYERMKSSLEAALASETETCGYPPTPATTDPT